jgi:hypothetical protein
MSLHVRRVEQPMILIQSFQAERVVLSANTDHASHYNYRRKAFQFDRTAKLTAETANSTSKERQKN